MTENEASRLCFPLTLCFSASFKALKSDIRWQRSMVLMRMMGLNNLVEKFELIVFNVKVSN